MIRLSHCSFLTLSLYMYISLLLFPLCFSVYLDGTVMDRTMISSMCHPSPSPPHTPTLSHPPVIIATCMRAPGRLNRFVKRPPVDERGPNSVACSSCAPLSLFRGTLHGGELPASPNSPSPSPSLSPSPPLPLLLLRHAEIIGLM